MPWKTRGNRSYYYQSERRGGRVVSTYVGPDGGLAESIARLDRLLRIRSRLAREDEREERVREAGRGRLIDRAVGRSEALAAWALTRAGYHRPACRHDWRKKRMTTTTTPATISPAAPPPSPLALVGRMERALAGHAFKFAGDDGESRKLLKADILAFAGELAGPDPPPIIRATAHIAAFAYFDWMLCRMTAKTAAPSPALARSIERAERRWHRAARSLHALQRRMPDVLVAIGQVNVMAGRKRGRMDVTTNDQAD